MLDTLSGNHALTAVTVVALCAAVSSLLATLLRGGRLSGGWPAAAILGGLLAGVLVGPGVLGRVAPALHDAAVRGGVAEQGAYDQRLLEAQGAVAALQASGVSEVAIDEYEREALAALGPLREAIDVAQVERRAALDFTLALAGAAILALLPLAGITRASGAISPEARRAALFAGMGSVALAGGIAFAGAAFFTSVGPSPAALLFAAACACGWFAPPLDRLAREGSRAVRASFVSGLFALGAASAVLLWSLPDRRAWFVAWAFIGALAVWATTKVFVRHKKLRRAASFLTLGVLAPTCVALAAMRLDPASLGRNAAFWILALVAFVAGADGRWIGAFLGARLGERSSRLVSPGALGAATAHLVSGVGVAQCALLAVLGAGGPISEPMLGAGLLAALLVENSAGLFRWAQAALDRPA